MAADHGDAGRIDGGFVVGRPIHRAALDDADAQPIAGDDRGRARRGKIGAGAGVQNAEPIQYGERGRDVVRAVIDVVGDADGMKAAKPQSLSPDLRIGKKPFGVVRPPRRHMQAAFQIGEHGVGRAQFGGNLPERNRRIGDVHQIDVTGQNQFACHVLPAVSARVLCAAAEA